MFRGSMVALVTPMHKGCVHVDKIYELVEFHIQQGTHAIIAAGTTGESGTLTHAEKLLVIKTVIDAAKERIPVIAGTGENATNACIELTKEAMQLGAHAALIMTPAYIRPTQEGLYQHYEHISRNIPLPVILYNVPTRTACDLLPETVGRLSKLSNIVGIKEATGTMERLDALMHATENQIDIYSGDDPTAALWMLSGAKGVISVTANVAAKWMAKLAESALDGDKAECLRLHEALLPLHRLMFVESNPIPVKWAVSRMGLMEDEIRLPLTPISIEYRAALEDAMRHLQLL